MHTKKQLQRNMAPQQQKMYPTQPCGGVDELDEFTTGV